MADYFTQFSVMFPVGASTNVERALALFHELEEQLERDEGSSIGFTAESVDEDPAGLWLYSDGHGEAEHVIAFAKQCGEAFSLIGRWGFCWALPDMKAISAAVRAVAPKPVNVLIGSGVQFPELAAAGVRRVSRGGARWEDWSRRRRRCGLVIFQSPCGVQCRAATSSRCCRHPPHNAGRVPPVIAESHSTKDTWF